MSRLWLATEAPLGKADPSQDWLEREHPEVLEARATPHAFDHSMPRDPRDTCPPEGNPGCICARCWERKSSRVHRGGAR